MTEPTRTVDDVLRDYRVIFSGRTRYAGQLPRDDDLLVAEIDRLRVDKGNAHCGGPSISRSALEDQWLAVNAARRTLQEIKK